MPFNRIDLYADVNIKASCSKLSEIEILLLAQGALFKGEDFQTDTFFEVEIGKLKLREGTIENLITHYIREEVAGEWRTRVFIYEKSPTEGQRQALLGERKPIGQVKKKRRIFFIDNVKFHLDQFEDGRSFVEIEAIDLHGDLGLEKIRQQAEFYKKLLQIPDQHILKNSYIDLI